MSGSLILSREKPNLATQLRFGGHGTSRDEACPFGGVTTVSLKPVSLISVHNGRYTVEEIWKPETA